MQFINLYHSLKSEIKQKINVLLLTKLNFSNYIDIFKLKEKKNLKIFLIDNNYNIASKFELLKTKIFNENVSDKLEENFGIYLDSENFIEELKRGIKIKINEKMKILKNSVFNPLIEINSYYLIYNECKKESHNFKILNEFYHYINHKLFMNDFEEKLCEEIIYFFYCYKKEKKKNNTKREITINEKEKREREKIQIKNNCDKINNGRLNKYINKKNITRLLLCKRNHY